MDENDQFLKAVSLYIHRCTAREPLRLSGGARGYLEKSRLIPRDCG
jgi:hypothetical protein